MGYIHKQIKQKAVTSIWKFIVSIENDGFLKAIEIPPNESKNKQQIRIAMDFHQRIKFVEFKQSSNKTDEENRREKKTNKSLYEMRATFIVNFMKCADLKVHFQNGK